MKTEPDLELAITRYAVVAKSWDDLGGGFLILPAFLAGWFCRACGASRPVDVGQFKDSFSCGWREADSAIVIMEREGYRS